MSESKYVVETGDGYLGIHPVSNSRCQITSGTIRPVGFTIGDELEATETDDGVALAHTWGDQNAFASFTVVWLERGGAPCVVVRGRVLEALNVSNGDDIRIYKRDKNSLLLVNADDDPRTGKQQNGGDT